MTITETEAIEAMLAHHRSLEDQVARRVGALRAAVDGAGPHEATVAELVTYLAEEVLPHATAEEHSIYEAASGLPDVASTVTEMIAEHKELASSIEGLAASESPAGARERAVSIQTLFAGHVAKENDLLLPALRASGTVSLAELLMKMHRLTEAAQREAQTAGDLPVTDTSATLLGLLTEAGNLLADAGQGDKACRLVARAWAALRAPRPDLAVRVTAALHRLVRTVTAEPVAFSRPPASGGPAGDDILDVRALAPAERHESIFAAYDALGSGGGFVLVNDHDPKPLRYQFEAEHAGEHTWEALEEGPTVWRVRIGRVGAAATSAAEAELDVRRLPHGQRHESIFAAYDALGSGGGFVLVNDHDPKPLRYQFEAQHAGEYTWDYLDAGPRVWRVRIGRRVGAHA
ncbi:MAG: DUF2249 domain-containing protein [Acidimicrobiales bacterium]